MPQAGGWRGSQRLALQGDDSPLSPSFPARRQGPFTSSEQFVSFFLTAPWALV